MTTGDQTVLRELVTATMPFGRYKGVLLRQLPEHYLSWYQTKGFPKGKLGMLMATMFEIRTNGLLYLLDPLIREYRYPGSFRRR